MLTDHIGAVLGYASKLSALSYRTMRSLGRAAFPLYLFMLVNGFHHTKDREKYLRRLFFFAAVSQLPFSAALTRENYLPLTPVFEWRYDADAVFFLALASAALFCYVARKNGKRLPAVFFIAFFLSRLSLKVGGFVLLGNRLNVMYTLACYVLLLCVLERLRERKTDALSLSAILAGLCVSADALRHSDYGLSALPLLVLFSFTGTDKRLQALATALWCLYKYPPTENLSLFFGALLSLLPILLFNGKEGRKSRLFYLVYPVHLLLLSLVPLAAG